ncbi:MAG: VCBS repeat-containing protein [Leptolyngbyaceae cyanobacterium SM2_5_2]|nr:VCBS repeat-containing protein [Leptolyngbyaceae cyanobacterium SM2_5_2]
MDSAVPTSTYQLTFNLGANWMMTGTADFDGNGELDILWQEQTTGELVISGIQNAASLTTLSTNPGPAWSVAATSDFDNDGKADILWRNGQTGETALWLMNDQGQASDSILLSPVAGENWSIGGAGDFNSDGSDDIVWQDANSDVLTVWLMENSQPTGEVLMIDAPAGSAWTVVGVSDFNTDGFADLLWRDTTGKTVIWLMQGNQMIGGGEVEGAFDSSWQITV